MAVVITKSDVCEICDELKARLTQTERTEQFTSLERLIPRITTALERLDALRWGARLEDGESVEELALELAVDAVRVLNEFRENSPVDPNW